MKKTILSLAAILAALMLVSCQMSSDDSGDTNKETTSVQGTKSDTETETSGEGTSKDPETKKPEETPSGGNDTKPEEKELNLGTTSQYSMKVGETIKLPDYIGEYEVYYQVQSGTDVVTVSSTGITADSVGSAVLKATDWNDESRSWSCSITVTADGFNGTALEYKLCGNWSREGGSSLVLNQDKTGTMQNYLNGELVQNWSFTWSGSEYSSNKFLNITDCYDSKTNKSVDDKQFTVTGISSVSLSIKGNLGFGMPSQTSWSKE